MGEKRERVYPVGTIRHWEAGDFIKCHDNSIFSSGWMPIGDIPEYLNELFIELDTLGNRIVSVKEPINGDIWLKKMLSEWEAPSGEIYSIDNFSQYFGFFGSARYSFRNEFSRRLLQEKIDLREFQNSELLIANEKKRLSGESNKNSKILLTKDEIKQIKEKAKRDFKFIHNPLDLDDPKALKVELEKILYGLQSASNLEGEDKEIYDKNMLIVKTLSDDYIPLKELNKKINSSIDEINNRFKDNFAIVESFKDKIARAKYQYIKKYSDRIRHDELENFTKEIGCDIFEPNVDKFYSSVESFLNSKKIDIDLNDYVGKFVPAPYDAPDYFLERIESDRYLFKEDGEEIYAMSGSSTINKIKEKLQLRESGIDINIPLQLRFNKLYNKDLQGVWDTNHISTLKATEKIFNYLPYKHAIGNSEFNILGKEGAGNNPKGAYACYIGDEKKIFLSDKFINETSRFTKVDDGNSFSTVMMHEIGHSVSSYLGRKKSLAYKIFAKECGWNWADIRQNKENYTATDGDKSVARTGINSEVPLITDYASKSPEEAFAENYSFYMMYKGSIDRYLDNNDDRGLKKNNAISTKKSEKTFGAIKFEHQISNKILNNFNTQVNANRINPKDKKHIDFSIVEPHKISISEEVKNNKSEVRDTIKYIKDSYSNNSEHLTIAVKDSKGKLKLLEKDDEYIVHSFHYLKKPLLVAEISEELYFTAEKSGLSKNDLLKYILNNNESTKIPEIPNNLSNVETKQGLFYDGSFIDSNVIKKNKNVFKAMRNIVNSEEFQKALEDNINVSGEQVMKKSTLIDLFKSHIIDPIKEINKKHYSDCFIFNNENKLLLLKRCSDDELESNKYCLPGGRVESGESFIDAAYRELLEESGLRTNLTYIDEMSNDDNSISHYYIGYITPYQDVELSIEHDDYVWVDKDNYNNYDLIFDLKDRIEAIFSDEDVVNNYTLFNQLFPNVEINEIKKAVECDLIEEKFLNNLLKSSYYSWTNVGNQGQLQFSEKNYDLTKQYIYYNNDFFDEKGNKILVDNNEVNLPVVIDQNLLYDILPIIKRKAQIYESELQNRKIYHNSLNDPESFKNALESELLSINNNTTIFDLYKSLSIIRRNIKSDYDPILTFNFGVDKTKLSLNYMLYKLEYLINHNMENLQLGIDFVLIEDNIEDKYNIKEFQLTDEIHNSLLDYANKKCKESIDEDLNNGFLDDESYLGLLKYLV